ncbi:MAG: hypothetical protein IKH75_11685 [Ruminococcus sp.]|nr:hypothetical protein [Ruminococcus sp.]
MAAEKIDALELDIQSQLSTENLDKLIESLKKLGKEVDNVSKKKPSGAIKAVGDESIEAASGVEQFLGKTVRLAAVIALFNKVSGVISDSVAKALTYNKTLNMFTVSLGEYADNATKYGNTVKDALGIDIAGWQNAQGIFQTLVTGFGVGGDQAAYMSQNLTQLSYDIASFYNLTNEEAQNKLKSAISGRLEPIRKLGWDLSQSKLVDIAKNPKYYGQQTFAINEQTGAIEANTIAVDNNTKHKIVNFNQLTQQEKVQLRYIALMTQVTQVQGAYAKALNDPVNQMKVFKEQLNMTSRELGNIFIPALNQVLPYLTAFAQLAGEAFRSIARFFGFEIPDMSDRMDISSVAEPYNDVVQATGAAAKNAKKLRDYTIGLDELNVLKKPDDTLGGGGGRVGENSNLSNLLTPGYDFLGKAVASRVEQVKADLNLLRKDLKEKPLQVGIEILGGGAAELGSKIWELILGKSPEEFALEAENNGFTYGEQFCVSFYDAFEERSESIIEMIFGDATSLGVRAAQAGNDVGKQFFAELTLAGLKVMENNPVFGFFYEKMGGRNLAKDIAMIEKNLQPKQTAKPSAPVGGYNYATANAPFDFTSNTDAFRSQGEKAMQAYADGMNSKIGAINTAGNNAFNSGLNGVGADGKGEQKFYNTAANEAYKFAMGISSTKAKNDAYNSGAALSYQGDKGARWWISDWIKAGDSSGQGYVAGVNKNKKSAASSGETIGKAALRRLKEYLGIHSPSTAFGDQAYWSVMGYAKNMERYSYLASDAAKDMANSALKAVETANDTLTSDMSVPATTNAGYGVGVANEGALMTLASNIYNAVVSGVAGIGNGTGGDTIVMIDGKEVFRVVKKEERKSGIAIGNGAFT